MSATTLRLLAGSLLAGGLVIGSVRAAPAPVPAQSQSCEARSGAQVPTLVELYTSEGCDSCPPADAWLARLKDRDDILALAFHVDYWDRLGWTDRFAQAAFTQRQLQTQAYSGASFAYTPQLLVDGRDWRGWQRQAEPPRSRVALRGQAPLSLHLHAVDAGRLALEVRRLGAGPAESAAVRIWWVVIEDGLHSDVRSGENRGRTLTHEHVVREYAQLGVWRPDGAGAHFELGPMALGPTGTRQLVVLASDAATGALLQAVRLRC